MDRVDKLLIKAKNLYGIRKKHLDIGFVTQLESGEWEAKGNLWDGKEGSGTENIVTVHKTKEEAVTALNELADQYPYNEDVPILILDYGTDNE